MPVFPGSISYAPFPEGFSGDMDEAFQQSGQLATIYISGNFISGIYYPIGTTPPPTLPTTDQGPVANGLQWYFFDPVGGAYLPQPTIIPYGLDTTNNVAYSVTISTHIGLILGTSIFVLPTNTNLINPTLNVNGLGAKNIVTKAGATLAAGTLIANTMFGVVYDGTSWRLFTQ